MYVQKYLQALTAITQKCRYKYYYYYYYCCLYMNETAKLINYCPPQCIGQCGCDYVLSGIDHKKRHRDKPTTDLTKQTDHYRGLNMPDKIITAFRLHLCGGKDKKHVSMSDSPF